MRSRLWSLLLVPLLLGAGQPIDPQHLAWDSSGGPDIVAGYEVVQGWDGAEIGSTTTGLSVPLAARTGTAYAARVRALPVDPETSPSDWATLAAEWPDVLPQIVSLSDLGRTTAPLPGGEPVMGASIESYTEISDSDNNTSVSAPVPSGLASGDLWIVILHFDCYNNASNAIAVPSGWTALSNGTHAGENGYPYIRNFYKLAGSSESAQTFSLTAPDGVFDVRGASIRISGVDQTTSVDTSAESTIGVTPPSRTVAADDSLSVVVAIGGSDGGTISPPSGYTLLVENESAYTPFGIAYKAVNAGTETPGAWTFPASAAYYSQTIIVKGAAGGAAATALPRRALDGPFYGALRGSVR